MATECNPQGVTIIEVNSTGSIIKTASGFGQAWRTPNATDCGSSEWLSNLVLAPDPQSLRSIVADAKKNGTFDPGDTDPGTSVTSCQCSVYLQSNATLPQPSAAAPKYFVLAQGNWTDKNGHALAKVPDHITPESKYVASAFIISESPIDKVPSLEAKWRTARDHAERAKRNRNSS